MTAKEWFEVIQQAEDYDPAMTNLIVEYGRKLLEEDSDLRKDLRESAEPYYEAKEKAVTEMEVALRDCIRYFKQHRNGGYNGDNLRHERGSCFEKALGAIDSYNAVKMGI